MSLGDFLPGGLGGITLAVGVGVFCSLLALGRAFVPNDPMAARIKAHQKRRRELRTALLASTRRGRSAPMGLLRRILDRLKLMRGEESRKASDLLAQAGWRSNDALAIFLGLRLAMPLLGGAGAFLLLAAIAAPGTPVLHRLLAALVGIVLGGFLPSLLLRNFIERRRQKLQKGLPDALDLLVICAEAGLSLDGALTRVAREMGTANPELADEFGLTAVELGFLPNRRDALLNLQRRVDTASFRGVVNTLLQTERYGTPLAQSLRVLAAEFRDQRMMKAEEKAGRLPAMLTVPMILFILPTLFIVLIGPAIIQAIKAFSH
jgi:tight adherence protein C